MWGKFGAAGLFLLAGQRVLLQHRAVWTNQGGTWGIPGGARDRHETPTQAALRETQEETGIDPADVEVLDALVTAGPFPAAEDLPGEWTYTTVLARTRSGRELPTQANEESEELRWVPLEEMEQLPLLPPFQAALGGLRQRLETLLR